MKANELKMAISLIEQLSGKFDGSRYEDTYSEGLMKLINAKAKGIKTKKPSIKIVHTKSKDLMEQLKEA